MSTGLRAPGSRGLARPAPLKKTGLSRPGGVTKTPSGNKVPSGSTPGIARSTSRGVLKSSASNHSLAGGLSRSGSTASVDMSPLKPGTRCVMKDTKIEGTIRYYGEPQFAKGTWVGVELDVEQGKNSGDVKGVQYFTCKPNHGLFCKPEKLSVLKEASVMRPTRTPSQANLNKVDYEAKFGLRIGSRVLVNGAKQGTLLFIGLTEFAKGVWAGVALDTDEGKNDGSVKGKRYFTCDQNYGLFAQASKIQALESQFSSSSSLASFETPRKNTDDPEVMKPDFVNRTPASTPGVTSSLSGILRSKSKDIESMQKNIGDLQQRLSEVNKTPTRNGPSIQSTPQRASPSSSEQYDQLKKIHEDSEKERSELVEKVKALEVDKLTFESRIAEVAEAGDKETTRLTQQLDQLNKEIVVLNANHTSQLSKLTAELQTAESELAASLDKVAEYEGSALANDNSAELIMNREKISELLLEIKSLRSSQETDREQIADLERQLSESLRQNETAQNDLNSKLVSLQGDSDELVKSQDRVAQLEGLLSESQESFSNLKNSSCDVESQLVQEKQRTATLTEELDLSKQQVADLEAQIIAMRGAHESFQLASDEKYAAVQAQLQEREHTISELKTELSTLSSSSTSEKLHLEGDLQEALSNATRFEEQISRDAARIADLEATVMSATSDSDSQVVAAHKKISELENRYSEREAESHEELKSVNELVTELRDELSQTKQQSSEQLEAANSRAKALQVKLDQVLMEQSMEQIKTEKEIGELQLQLAETDKLQSENSRLSNNLNSLQAQLSSVQTKCNELQASNKAAAQLQTQLDAVNSEHSNLVASLENNIDELETRLATVNNDKAAEAEMAAKREAENVRECRRLEGALAKATQDLAQAEDTSNSRIAALETQLAEERTRADAKTGEASSLTESLDRVQNQLEMAENQLRDLAEECDAKRKTSQGHSDRVSDLEKQLEQAVTEKAGLTHDLGNVTREMGNVTRELAELKVKTNRQSDEEIENLHKQISNLNDENEMMKLAFTDKSTEFDELSKEVSTLREISETAFLELKKNEEQFTSAVKQLRATELQLNQALDSIKGLQTKINDLEEEVVRERARACELEQRLHSPPEMSFEYVDNLSNLSTSPPVSAPSFIPERLFCDNCDVFDDHDTTECPLAMSPGGVKHGGARGPSGRPYCTVCEMFGHTAEECEDDMTF